jgi:hypothetical protein
MQELLDAINRLDAALEAAEFENAKRDLGDLLDLLEGIIPGFVNPLPPVSPPPAA